MPAWILLPTGTRVSTTKLFSWAEVGQMGAVSYKGSERSPDQEDESLMKRNTHSMKFLQDRSEGISNKPR